ncbi:class I SAM-dependent methyltransferase [Methanosarcina mazei]|nr:class I SAM-dependent methyltransferase [Methanosarcina mazei]
MGINAANSSSYFKHRSVAVCDNYCETRLLEDVLSFNISDKSDVFSLDLGSGLGRFTRILSKYSSNVTSIEPAENLYNEQKKLLYDLDNVSMHQLDFESYNDSKKFDAVVISGVLLYYSEDGLRRIFGKLKSHMNPGCVVVVRDFITPKGIMNTGIDADDQSYFRDIAYWKQFLQDYNISIEEVFQCRPSYLSRFKGLLKPKKMSTKDQVRDSPTSREVNGFISLVKKSYALRVLELPPVRWVLYRRLRSARRRCRIDFTFDTQNVFMVLKFDCF